MKKLTILSAIILLANLLFSQVNIVDDSFYSEVLQQEMLVDVFLPPNYEANPDQYYPVVYYLHGYGGNQNSLALYASTANNLMLNESIEPFIMVCPNNQSGPFGGTMYMNSPLWGDFATFNFTELVNYIESNYRAISNKDKRALMGQSMGGFGCFENGPSNKNKFRAIAAHGYPGVFEENAEGWQEALINEQTSGPPYYYNFNSGEIFTKLCFLACGAYAPNLNSPQTWINPATVEYIYDDQGEYIDTVFNKWLEHSGHKLVQELTPDDDFGILFGCGQNDELLFYPGAAALKDSLDAYGIPSQFFSHTGGHSMPNSFVVEAYTFLDSIFNIESNSCLPEGIIFATQEEIDNFQINYPNCEEIEGDVYINGFDIVNLNGLNVLTSIGGYLLVFGSANLVSLDGLDNINSIGGYLGFSQNSSLTSLNALSNLSFLGGSLGIYNNPVLSTLSGLEGIASVGGDISISYNDALNNLLGLENITYVEGLTIQYTHLNSLMGLNLDSIAGNVDISWNNSLINLSGLDNLAYIGGDLNICINDAMTSYTGLEHLITIAGDLRIGDCFNSPPFYDISLTSISALESLASVSRLYVMNNLALTSLEGLENIDANSLETIFIYNNWNLSECDVQSICDYLASPGGFVNISQNAPGCNSIQEVDSLCNPVIPGVNDCIYRNLFTISPNPVNDQAVLSLNIQSRSSVEICIYNTTGICLKNWQFQNQQPGKKEFEINLKDIQAGIYFCQVRIGNEMVTKKIIKVK